MLDAGGWDEKKGARVACHACVNVSSFLKECANLCVCKCAALLNCCEGEGRVGGGVPQQLDGGWGAGL